MLRSSKSFALLTVGLALAAVPLQPYRGSVFTVSFPRSWTISEDAGNGLMVARQDPRREDSAAVMLIVKAAGTSTADQILDTVAGQFAQNLRIISRTALQGGGQMMVADGRSGALFVRVGVIAVAQGGVSVVSLMLAKPAEFDALGGIELVTGVLASMKANNAQPAPAPTAAPPPPASGGRLDVPPLTNPLTMAALAGEWNNDDSVMSTYVNYRGDYAGFQSISTKEKWIFDGRGGVAGAFTGTTAGRGGARQVNEKRTGAVTLSHGPVIHLGWTTGSPAQYLVRGWRELPGITVMKLNGPWYDGVPADVMGDRNKGVNLDSLWFRKTKQ